MKKLLQGAKLSKHLDGLVRKYFKLNYGDNPQCFVCGRFDGWFNHKTCPKGIQVGHYISRKWNILRWDLRNVYPQCSGCNKLHNNNPAPFTLAIIDKFGSVRITQLNKIVDESRGSRMPTSAKREKQKELEILIKNLSNGS